MPEVWQRPDSGDVDRPVAQCHGPTPHEVCEVVLWEEIVSRSPADVRGLPDAFDDEREDESSLVRVESSVQAGHEHGAVLWRNSAIERW